MKARSCVGAAFVLVALCGCGTVPALKSADASKARAMGGYYLPRVIVDYKVEHAEDGTLSVTATERTIPGDWVALGLTGSLSSSDDITVELENGYLKSINATSDDKTADAIKVILSGISGLTGKPAGADARVKFTPKAVAFTLDVDNPKFARELLFRELKLCISATTQGKVPSGGVVTSIGAASGIFYPVERQWRAVIWAPENENPDLDVTCKEPVATRILDDRSLLVPSTSHFARIDIDRTRWVKRETSLEFHLGRLVKVGIKKPSQAAAVASIPTDILKTLVGIPAQLVQFKIDTSGREKALATARVAEINAELDYLEALKKLQDANEAPGDSSSGNDADELNDQVGGGNAPE